MPSLFWSPVNSFSTIPNVHAFTSSASTNGSPFLASSQVRWREAAVAFSAAVVAGVRIIDVEGEDYLKVIIFYFLVVLLGGNTALKLACIDSWGRLILATLHTDIVTWQIKHRGLGLAWGAKIKANSYVHFSLNCLFSLSVFTNVCYPHSSLPRGKSSHGCPRRSGIYEIFTEINCHININ